MNFDYLKKFRLTSNWRDHIRRGSRGGHDFAMPTGTPLIAHFSGIALKKPNNGLGGNTVELISEANPKNSLEYLHISEFGFEEDFKFFEQGEVFSESGGEPGSPGAGLSTGAHLHIHGIISGKRVPYTRVLEKTKAREEGEEMKASVFVRIGTVTREWSLVAPWVEGTNPLERGYRITSNKAVAIAWERRYLTGAGSAHKVPRDDYVKIQEEARIDYENWKKNVTGK